LKNEKSILINHSISTQINKPESMEVKTGLILAVNENSLSKINIIIKLKIAKNIHLMPVGAVVNKLYLVDHPIGLHLINLKTFRNDKINVNNAAVTSDVRTYVLIDMFIPPTTI